MKRVCQIVLIGLFLVACGSPAAVPSPTWTNEAPKKAAVTIIFPATATTAPTFTPIPFTLTATNTLTPTLTSTIAATVTKVKATLTRLATKAPTRTLRPTSIPTVFIPPTYTLAPIVIQPTNPPAQVCCKICRTGKACGDTCISREKTCHVGKGCACNG